MKSQVTLDERFNRNVLSISCLVGLLRVILELNTYAFQPKPTDFYLDLSFGLIFLITLITLLSKVPYRYLYFTFYFPLIITLCLSFIRSKGLAGTMENYIHVSLIVIVLTAKGKDPIRFTLLLLAGVITSLFIIEDQHHFLTSYTDYATSSFNFIYMGIGTVIVIFYGKKVFETSKEFLSQLESNLKITYQSLDSSRARMEKQTSELKSLNNDLEIKVQERLAELNSKKMAMQSYLQLTLEELEKEHASYDELVKRIAFQPGDNISEMIEASSEKLNMK